MRPPFVDPEDCRPKGAALPGRQQAPDLAIAERSGPGRTAGIVEGLETTKQSERRRAACGGGKNYFTG